MSKLTHKLKAWRWRHVILLVALLALTYGGYKAYRVWALARSLQGRLNQLQMLVDGGGDLEPNDIGDSLRGARADLEALRGETALFVPATRYLGWLPGVGGDLQSASALLDMATAVTEAGTMAFDGLEPLLALLEEKSVDGEPLALALQTLTDARPDLVAAQDRLATALELRAKIDDDALSARTADLLAQLDRYLPLIETALDGAQLLPDLLGGSGRRTYLLLAQNDDELRATGGFISAVGTLTLEDGEIGEITFEDSYALDDFRNPYPDPPAPYLRYLGIDQWVFRDANWSPDFPTSARQAVTLYQISRDLAVDGVLAVDQQALQIAVAALAPLEVKGWPEVVTGDNVVSLIRLAWTPPEEASEAEFGEWWRERKNFIGDLVEAIRAKVEGAPGEVDWVALARAVFQMLDERHLQVWLADADSPAVDLLAEQGWDGALHPAASDYLLVVDTNMGFNKANGLVQQSIDYQVSINADGTAEATLTVRHFNPSVGEGVCDHRPHYGVDYEAMMNRCYWDYLRVYAPAGSQLKSATVHPVEADLLVSGQPQSGEAEVLPEEKGKAVFASFFVLPRGQETETLFAYQLPPAAVERHEQGWRYRLLVQKQAGTQAVPLRVSLVLPPGTRMETSEPAAQRPEPNRLVFDTSLDTDQAFEISYQYDRD